ncbi:acyl-CoA/acyl-ACP dehydrogenase [Calidifontimicrobium sp. SYSU G02091]|uniref:acyl-CoA dehydrogenase family protein n=1 Tax=Calidifontimicrobium sp. SYSU G02091 TaxID=2926421 RepID=UPI001F53AC69|nr:acyl-CoA dehydrogenase family protein [Calidifontimicrobium sp. SYSU G02091]MCI1191391.1 acyl-CoA/acyl-ACP dehydrogenase [Calidifontimicrobium sp. SYSU G02091]
MAAVLSEPAVSRYVPSHIAGDASKLTAQQRELIERASRLGREKFAPRAARHDREASFPIENFRDLADAGLLAICVPKAHGGEGADFTTYVMVAAEIGRWCGSTALSYNMHVCSCMWSGFIADALDMTPEQRADHERIRAIHYARIVQGGKIYAQPFSEGGAAAAGKAPWGTLAAKVDGGYVVNGRKIFASLSGAADYYGVLCTLDRPGATLKDSMYLAVPADAPGVTVSGEWDPLGMRGTVSRTLTFKDVFVPDEARLMPEGLYAQAAARFPHMFATLSPTYMGIAQAAYDFTVQYLRGEVPGMPPVKRRMYPTKQVAVAEMRIKLEQTRALFLQNARDARVDPDKDTRMRLLAAHYTIMENANDICRLAIRTCGGQSMLKSLPLERLYRDSRCGSLMLPWTAELCIDRLGRECLYEAGERDEAIEA